MKTEIIPVIHMLNINQVLTNVNIVKNAGLNKVFIINHTVSDEDLINCALYVKAKYPELWIGINRLSKTQKQALSQNIEVDALWCDQTISIEDYQNKQFKGQVFGGIAFKYQPQPKDIKQACIEAISATDVATTSGPGTAHEADINKILTIRECLKQHPMAIASGVNSKNILQYKGIVNYLLVASSITSRSEIIQEDKLNELIQILN